MVDHSGHRDRLRERFLNEGLDHFTDAQALELLLFYSVPRRDTSLIAHSLLSRFGSLSQVLEAPLEDLCRVEGITPNSAVLLQLVTQLGRRYMIDRSNGITSLTTLSECAEYMLPFFFGRKVETVFLLCLDAKCKLLCCRKITEGNVNSTGLSIRRVVETALNANASCVMLAHNHPGGLALPSKEDVASTKLLASALAAVDVVLVDHIVVADDDYVSMAESGIRFLEG